MKPHKNTYQIYYNNDLIGEYQHPKIDSAKWLIAQNLAVVEDILVLIYDDEIIAQEQIWKTLGLTPMQKPVIVEKIVEKIVYVDREVQAQVQTKVEIVEKIIEKPVYIDKFYEREKQIVIDQYREVIYNIPRKYARYLKASRKTHKEYTSHLKIKHEKEIQNLNAIHKKEIQDLNAMCEKEIQNLNTMQEKKHTEILQAYDQLFLKHRRLKSNLLKQLTSGILRYYK